MPKFTETSCSQCGQTFGPGDHGYSHCDQHRKRSGELHIVIGKDGFIREQTATQSFEAIVRDIISGQYDEDAERVLRITDNEFEDVTEKTAWAIYGHCDGFRTHVLYDSAAYRLVEHNVGIVHAGTCLDQRAEAAE